MCKWIVAASAIMSVEKFPVDAVMIFKLRWQRHTFTRYVVEISHFTELVSAKSFRGVCVEFYHVVLHSGQKICVFCF